ncbi:putative GNAT family acetyltransferase [Martelella mediterranea]|uniref:Putative GNAT family acetyltransferase n=1 Tax=Martelella mediterranea TaxID=293089 RepID=A0A4R3NV32_9HYPH|nr:putative GNAT family acetyltransferase [Martelella mediterranea]
MVAVRPLRSLDKDLLVSFLSAYAESSMFLLSNLAADGIENPHLRYGGDYWGAFDEAHDLIGVAAHYSNGNVIVQLPEPSGRQAVLTALRQHMTRPVAGVIGPDAEVVDALRVLDPGPIGFAINRGETLFSLSVGRLAMPAPRPEHVSVTHWSNVDQELLHAWLLVYRREAMGQKPTSALEKAVAAEVRDPDALERFVLLVNDVPVALAGFNARLPEMLQLGSVFTPPEHRSRGYARYLIGQMLHTSFGQGVKKVILFTNDLAAERAYRSLGFAPIGDYRLAIFNEPTSLT